MNGEKCCRAAFNKPTDLSIKFEPLIKDAWVETDVGNIDPDTE
jgi:hypothetical protein